MIRALWIAKTGMDVQQTNMDVISNNLANVSTTGFKRARPVFNDLLYQTLRPAGGQTTQQSNLPNGLELGTGAHTVATTRMFTQGNLQQTENQLDIAIGGNGFYQIEQADGSTAYTRDGSFRLNADGRVVTANGDPVISFPQVPQGTLEIVVGKDGTVAYRQPGQNSPQVAGQLELATFVNPAGLESAGNNLYKATIASGDAVTGTAGANGIGLLNQSYIETSNVNATEELVNMIQAQRAFEINSRAIQASDQMLQKLSQL